MAQYYILGYPHSDIENRADVSHGSVVNIAKELEDSRLTVPGTTFDQVNDLRQLSFDLQKKGLEPSQALLGLLLFDRLQTLEITPELVDKWSELAKKLLPVDFPAKDFLEAALRLDELAKREGKSFAVGFALQFTILFSSRKCICNFICPCVLRPVSDVSTICLFICP